MNQQTTYISVCPLCGKNLKLVPAGVSKTTGRPYKAFYSCMDMNCDYTAPANGKATKTGVKTITEPTPQNGNLMLLDEIRDFRKEMNIKLAAIWNKLNN